MFLFTRTTSLQGPPADTMTWAGSIANYVSSNSDLDISAWAVAFGAPMGTVRFNAVVESRAQLADSAASLVGDAAYMDLVSQAADWLVGPPNDSLRGLMTEPPADAEPPAVGSVALTTSTVSQGGKIVEVMAFGVEMASYVTSVTGIPVMFLSETYGTVGAVSWIGISEDMAGVDAAEAALAADAGYLERVNAAGDLFLPGSGQRALSTRIA